MSPIVGLDMKNMRSSSFVGTLKRFFKNPKTTDEGRSANGEISSKALGAELDTTSIGSQLSQNGVGPDSSSPVFSSRKSSDRHFQAHSTGTVASSSYRPIHVSQAALHHSLSDPCDNPLVQVNVRRPNLDEAGSPTSDLQKQRPPAGARRAPFQASSFRHVPRSDLAALPSLYDASTRSCSLDLQSGTSASPLGIDASVGRGRQFAAVSLPSVDSRPCSRPSGSSASQLPAFCEAPPSEAPPPASKTTLLALCPGTPAAMRRRDWSLEDYDVTRKVYKGATSAVYKATCRRSGLVVALKVYFLSKVPSNVIHMIIREIKIHIDLVHKGIIMLYAAFQDEKRLVLVQEYAARGDLYGIHRAMNRRMTEAQLTTLVLAPFLDALAYLHARGICHRDIKPENLLFTQDWRMVIADFGVSIDLNQERAVTRAGTLEYMAPEVERCPLKMLPEENKDQDSLAYTTAVDIWAVGVLAYELMVGFPPFVADGAAATGNAGGGAGVAFLAAHATRKTLSFPASTSALARDFIALTLAEAPEERPTALQLRGHPWLAGVQATSPVASHQPPPRRSSGQLTSFSVTPLVPSRLGSAFLASAPNTGAVPMSPLMET